MALIGVVGVGRMGAPIARALAEHHEVLLHDPAHRDSRPLADLTAAVDVLMTVLPGIPEFSSVAPLVTLQPGALWIDLTSNDPRVLERITGVDLASAPMAGGPSAASARSLRFYASGAVERARPYLDLLGTVDDLGPAIGAGCTTKLLANLLWFGQAVAVTEALLLGKALGLPVAGLRATLATTAGGSVFIDEYLDSLLDGDYLESFGIDRCVEELETLASLARGADVPFELSTLVARLHRDALERFGAIDGELLAAKLLEERAGARLRR